MVKRTLTPINASAEFNFPLQLVYLSNRGPVGDFGPQWVCPQLESRLLPQAQGVLVWTMPSGGMIGLFAGKKATQLTDRQGEWEAKITGALTVVSNAEGWQYTYRSGRLINIHAPSSRDLEFAYKGSNLATIQLTDPSTGTSRLLVTITRQANDRIIQLDAPEGRHIFDYENGRDGRLLTWKHPGLARPDRFLYNKIPGLLTGIQPGQTATEPLVYSSEFTKPVDGNKKEIKEPNAEKKLANYRLTADSTYRYEYSDHGKITLTDKSGGTQSLEYTANRGIQTSVDAAGIETKTYFYRAPGKRHDGKLRRIEQGGKTLVDNFYDLKTGNLIESRDQNNLSTFYEYDPATADKPLLADKPIAIYQGKKKDRTLLARIKYDPAGRVIEKTVPAIEPKDAGNAKAPDQTTRYTYTARGQLDTITDTTGKKTQIAYDKVGRTTTVIDGEQRQEATYDDQGRVATRKTPDGQTIETSYDTLGNVSGIKQNGIVINTFDRDPNGRFIIQRDALSRPSWNEYDTRGRLLAEHQPNGSTTWYGYDATGHRTDQIDGQGNHITFGYDTAGRLIEQRNPLGQTLTWKYDGLGRLKRRTNGVQTITYNYDDDSRLTLLDYGQPGEKLRYRYDERGRIRKITTPTNSLSLFYDSQGRIAAKQFIRGFQNSASDTPTSDRVIRYSYNTQGQKTSTVLSERLISKDTEAPKKYRLLQQTQYTYDTAGRLGEIRSNGTAVSTFRYDTKGRLFERTYGNGIVGRYTYDTFGRQARLDLGGGPLIEPLLLAYDWDAAGQLKSRTWNGETQIYGYDLSGQLTSVVAAASTSGSAGVPPAVSGASPETTKNAQTDSSPAQRQFVSNPAPAKPQLLEKYRYDNAGNLLEKYENGLTTTLTYDTANQLSTTTVSGRVDVSSAAPGVPPGASPILTKFTYDKAGRLVSEAGPAGKTRTYGFLDKVLVLQKPDGTRLGYDYYPDGQLAAKGPLSQLPAQQTDENGRAVSSDSALNQKASKGLALLKELVGLKAEENDSDLTPSKTQSALSVSEELVWDGLALLYRNGESFAIEPHFSGGIPVASTRDPQNGTPTYYLNDILGTTLAVVRPNRVEIVPLTAFGKPRSSSPTISQSPTTNHASEPSLSPENDSSAQNQTEKQNK